MDNTKIHPKDIQEDDKELCFFIYNNKYEYTKRRNEMFDEIKDSIIITDSAYKLIIYSGIYDLYKVMKINSTVKKHLNILTRHEQKEWVDNTCWQIFKIVETGFDSLSSEILRIFRNHDVEKYLYELIYNSLMGINLEGYLSFIEEKNVYMEEEEDLIEELPINEDTVIEIDTELIN